MAVALVEQYCLSHKLDLEDALIAATAIVNDIKLYTLNTKEEQAHNRQVYCPVGGVSALACRLYY
jgi:predicted nucleic acid-binding protein